MKKNYFVLLFFLFGFISKGQNTTIDSLYFQGNIKTKTSFLMSLIKVSVGDDLDSNALERDIEQLKRIPSIGHAYYQLKYLTDNKVIVTYGIKESYTILPEVSLWSSKGRTWFKAGIHEYNTFGKNIAIGGLS